MARITRKTQKVFASSASSDQITAFGTAKTSNPTYTTDVDAIQTATYEQGWTPSLMSDLAPYLQDSNALWYATTKQLAYLFQEGIAEWDSGTEYGLGSWVKYNKSIYESTANNNINHQVSDTNYWQKADFSYGGLTVGTVFPSLVSSTFTPNGCVPCDGAEYSGVTFGDLFNNYLVTGKLATCTYTEYQQDINTYGNCIKFGIDTVNQRFKVPTISDGTFIEQGTNNTCYNAGLPNITGSIHFSGTDDWANSDGAFTTQMESGAGRSHNSPSNGGVRFTLNASRSSSIYNNNVNTVQPKAVELRYFVVVSTGDLNKADMDWSEYIQNINNKLKLNLDNATAETKNGITTWGLPNYTAGISFGSGYTAPRNGVIRVRATANNSNSWDAAYINGVEVYSFKHNDGYAMTVDSIIPISKGDVVTTNSNRFDVLIFYPLKGAS